MLQLFDEVLISFVLCSSFFLLLFFAFSKIFKPWRWVKNWMRKFSQSQHVSISHHLFKAEFNVVSMPSRKSMNKFKGWKLFEYCTRHFRLTVVFGILTRFWQNFDKTLILNGRHFFQLNQQFSTFLENLKFTNLLKIS
jgi:hypothetical protein